MPHTKLEKILLIYMFLICSTTRFALACNTSSKIIEPIQSRCAIVRFNKLSEEEILERLKHVIDEEKIAYNNDGLQAILFTADGDMRQALNNLQATHYGFGMINSDNVFRVVDQPHPLIVQKIIKSCMLGEFDAAYSQLAGLWKQGYSALDLIQTLFRVAKVNCALSLSCVYLQLV